MNVCCQPVYLEKRTWDDRFYDIDCTPLLDENEQITGFADPDPIVIEDVAAADVGPPPVNPWNTSVLVAGDPITNAAPVYYPSLRTTADIGKAIQFELSGGTLEPGSKYRYAIIRVRFVTNINPQLEATVVLRLTDQP
jgi:hypothetical protein